MNAHTRPSESYRLFERGGRVLFKMILGDDIANHAWYMLENLNAPMSEMQRVDDVYVVSVSGDIVIFFLVFMHGSSSLTWGVRKPAGFWPPSSQGMDFESIKEVVFLRRSMSCAQ